MENTTTGDSDAILGGAKRRGKISACVALANPACTCENAKISHAEVKSAHGGREQKLNG
jgi:hypothetical protein